MSVDSWCESIVKLTIHRNRRELMRGDRSAANTLLLTIRCRQDGENVQLQASEVLLDVHTRLVAASEIIRPST